MMTNEVQKNKRRYKREIFNYKVDLIPVNEKNLIHCASFDLSEGGIRIVTNVKLDAKKAYQVKIDSMKITAHPVHQEERPSSMMNQMAFYYGMRFDRPISPDLKNKLLKVSAKIKF